MKTNLLLFFLLYSIVANCQTVNFRIIGTVKNTEHAKYAYLSTLSQQIPISSDKIFMKVPIIDHRFKFKGTFDLEGKDYQQACIFLDDRSDISKEELKSKFQMLVWVVGRDENLRGIILENITLDVDGRDKMNVAKVVDGGTLTKQNDESSAFFKVKGKLPQFIKKYPNSPVSFTIVKEIVDGFSIERKEHDDEVFGSLNELYSSLSSELRMSKKGIALKKETDEKLKKTN